MNNYSPDNMPLTPKTLIVFIDETGSEYFSDPNNPTFGRAGCATLGRDYKSQLKKPWRKLKREKLGGVSKPFHAADFGQTNPTRKQIFSINRFLQKPFWRFAVMSDYRTQLPEGVDGHRAVSLMTIQFIKRLVTTFDADRLALFFESSFKR